MDYCLRYQGYGLPSGQAAPTAPASRKAIMRAADEMNCQFGPTDPKRIRYAASPLPPPGVTPTEWGVRWQDNKGGFMGWVSWSRYEGTLQGLVWWGRFETQAAAEKFADQKHVESGGIFSYVAAPYVDEA